MSRRLVLAHVLREQRRIFGLVLFRSLGLTYPPVRPLLMPRDALFEQRSEFFS
jgi:hypothetical protein